MARFLLIHGASHGAWCWGALRAALVARGHEATAIDLPAHGDDSTPPAEATLDGYVAAILAALSEPAIVVAHSMAGVPATAAADRAPDRVARLVYLCAYLPGDGDSVGSLVQAQATQPLRAAIRRGADRDSFTFAPELVPELFYNGCPPDTVARALNRLTPEPVVAQATPVSLSGDIAEVPRSYILCTEDHAIPPEDQRRMASALPPGDVHERPWSHSPFFSAPEALADLLGDIAAG